MSEPDRITLPNIDEMRNDPIQQLHDQWKKNNAILLHRITQNPTPFFGLHGTPKPNLPNLQKEGGDLQIGTFYEKNLTPQQQLTAMTKIASYTSFYANKDNKDLGGIVVVNLGKEENPTMPWEELFLSEDRLGMDSDEDYEIASDPMKYGQRSDVAISGTNDPQYAGTHMCQADYYDDLGNDIDRKLARSILQSRFRAQSIIQGCLSFLE